MLAIQISFVLGAKSTVHRILALPVPTQNFGTPYAPIPALLVVNPMSRAKNKP